MIDLLAPVERLNDVLEELEAVREFGLGTFDARAIREVSSREQADDAAEIDLRLDVTTFFDTGEGILGVNGLILLQEGLEAMDCKEWMFKRVFALVPAQYIVGDFVKEFAEYPPRQKPGSFGLERVMEQLMNSQQN